jgi:hypothetical protein
MCNLFSFKYIKQEIGTFPSFLKCLWSTSYITIEKTHKVLWIQETKAVSYLVYRAMTIEQTILCLGCIMLPNEFLSRNANENLHKVVPERQDLLS